MEDKHKSEKEKMLSNEPYLAYDRELAEMHLKARNLFHDFNSSSPEKTKKRKNIIESLFGSIGSNFEIKPPFYQPPAEGNRERAKGKRQFTIDFKKINIDLNLVVDPLASSLLPL